MKLANGSHTETRALLPSSVSFGDKEKSLNLLLTPDMGDSLVLGWDFLVKFGTTVTCQLPNDSTKERKIGWWLGG